MGKTSIEWCDYSWPVVNGCRRISPGCGGAARVGGCYAERLISTRLSKTPKYQGLAVFGKNGPHWTGETRLWQPHLDMPLKLRKPSKIFVADMGDLFYEGVSDRDIDQVFGVMWACCWLGRDAIPGHVFQVLTKRADRMREYLSGDRAALAKRWADAAVSVGGGENPDALWDAVVLERAPHPRIWLGVSVENQQYADERIPALLDTPAAVRFLSVEPMIGPVDLRPFLSQTIGANRPAMPRVDIDGETRFYFPCIISTIGVDWVIVGSESGPGARPMDIKWAKSIRDQCAAADTPMFTKQIATPAGKLNGARKGGDPQWWPDGPWPREFPR